jgi:hypothetical protein
MLEILSSAEKNLVNLENFYTKAPTIQSVVKKKAIIFMIAFFL